MAATSIVDENLIQNQPDALEEEVAVAAQTSPRVIVSLELIVYVVLILFALTLRLPELGTIPLGDGEAHEALAAIRALGTSPGLTPTIAHNPLMFTTNTLTMAIFGNDTATARLPTVLVGLFIITLPIFFRRWLGSATALIAAALLTISPVLLLASRTMSGSVWALALALLAIYFLGRYIEARRIPYALGASTAALLLVFMAEPGGFITFLGMAGGVLFALYASEREGQTRRQQALVVVRSWPWLRSLLVGTAVILVLGTVFLIYPRGLSAIGQMAALALQGFVQPAPGYGSAYPLATSLLYEPVLWIFGLAGAYLILRREPESIGEPVRFWQLGLVGWLGISILAALLYRGGQSQHALWLTLPLVGLSAVAVERIFTPVRDQFWNPPAWGTWVYGLAVVAMIAIAGVNLVAAGQTFSKTPPDQAPQLDVLASLRTIVEPAVIIVILIMTGVMIAGMWGRRTAWRGIGIGALAMFSLLSFGAGWRAAVSNADNAREFWRPLPAARNLNLLETTLKTASQRVTGTLIDVPILIQSDPNGPIDDGALAWALRRFHNLQYVTEIPPTTNTPVLMLPESAGKPATTASYVGQAFPVYFTWDRRSLSWDILLWLYNRESRVQPTPYQRVIVWVRSDGYGVPPQSSTSQGGQPAPNQSGQSNSAGPGSAK